MIIIIGHKKCQQRDPIYGNRNHLCIELYWMVWNQSINCPDLTSIVLNCSVNGLIVVWQMSLHICTLNIAFCIVLTVNCWLPQPQHLTTWLPDHLNTPVSLVTCASIDTNLCCATIFWPIGQNRAVVDTQSKSKLIINLYWAQEWIIIVRNSWVNQLIVL